MAAPHARVLFAAAAGPRLGFGHLVRCGVLADALRAPRCIVLRGSRATAAIARHHGWTVLANRRATTLRAAELVVVDDPSAEETRRWVRLARRMGVPVASIHDGDSTGADADLVIDGSVRSRPDGRRSRLAGPLFAILRPHRAVAPSRERAAARVLIALGGGVHVRRLGRAIASAIVAASPNARVHIAAGFVKPNDRAPLPARCRWVSAPAGLAGRLSAASVAVVAGGITLYEACAIGTPAVAVPVVPAQWPAIAAANEAGAVIAVDVQPQHRVQLASRVGQIVADLLEAPSTRATLACCGRRLVDGHGTRRVVAALRRLRIAEKERVRHAA